MPDQIKAKGILRNRPQPSSIAPSENSGTPNSTSSLIEGRAESAVPFDRNAVLENTRANAQIHSVGNSIIQKHKVDLEEELSKDPEYAAAAAAAHLKWNEANLYLNEQEKFSTMKITEPKTPFQGAVGDSEYYKPDEDDDELNLPPAFDSLHGEALSLGEAEVSGPDPTIQTNRIIVDEKAKKDEENDDEEEEPEETPEERHKRFEAMRRNHYYMKGAVMHKPVEDDDDDE
jgi:protein phosphatase inhibitor 2